MFLVYPGTVSACNNLMRHNSTSRLTQEMSRRQRAVPACRHALTASWPLSGSELAALQRIVLQTKLHALLIVWDFWWAKWHYHRFSVMYYNFGFPLSAYRHCYIFIFPLSAYRHCYMFIFHLSAYRHCYMFIFHLSAYRHCYMFIFPLSAYRHCYMFIFPLSAYRRCYMFIFHLSAYRHCYMFIFPLSAYRHCYMFIFPLSQRTATALYIIIFLSSTTDSI
jgi:hypothetical protein